MSDTVGLPKALYKGVLQIGNAKLSCAVLDNEQRVISETSLTEAMLGTRSGASKKRKKELERVGAPLPLFLAPKQLEKYIPDELRGGAPLITYIDGTREIEGYDATILPIACDVWLAARAGNSLQKQQLDKAQNAEILMRSLAKVGIIALIDEATGFQYDRKYDALRVLLETYLADKIKPWTKQFPDQFFSELDRLYGNQNLKSSQRPSYYGKFINKYVYDPLENGAIDAELQQRYKADDRKHRKHQHFTEFGTSQLRLQIGRIMGLLEVAPSLRWFKEKQNRQGQIVLFDPDELE